MGVKSLAVLSGISLMAAGVLGAATSAEAAQLAPGRIGLTLNEELFYQNNVLDVTPDGGNTPSLGTNGGFQVTFTDGIFTTEGFNGIGGTAYDLYLPPASISSINSAGQTKIVDDVFYNVGAIAGPVKLLTFDNGVDYNITGFTRQTNEQGGAFRVSFDFEGFFSGGGFDNTPSIISLFTGSTFENPNLSQVVTNTQYPNSDPFRAASINGIINTEVVPVPEPATTLGLLAFGALAATRVAKRKQS